MSGDAKWTGAVDTIDGAKHHRTVGGRAWCECSEWCYPSNWCSWCHEQAGDTQFWLPAEDSSRHDALVSALWDAADDALMELHDRHVGSIPTWAASSSRDAIVNAVLAALKGVADE